MNTFHGVVKDSIVGEFTDRDLDVWLLLPFGRQLVGTAHIENKRRAWISSESLLDKSLTRSACQWW